MSKSLAQIYTHIIFSTKNRSPFINKKIRNELRLYISKILQNHGTPVLAIEAIQDHVHILCSLSKNNALCKIIEEVKKELIEVDQNQGWNQPGILLAKWVWRFLRELIPTG